MRSPAIILLTGALLEPPLAAAQQLTPPIASYKISCRLDEGKKTVEGTELLTWKNTTSRPAGDLRFHLYLNAFRNNRSSFSRESGGKHRDVAFREDGGWGSISVSRMTDESGTDLLSDMRYISPDDGNPDDRTVAEIPLPSPVAPGETIRLSLDFVSRLPRVYARTGYKGDFYMVAQWFPKIGVLEESGWNCHQYHANSEFFADFGDYDVTIDLNARYKGKVGGTGRLIEERDAPGGRVIEHFRQESVHDFAWTCDPGFEVFSDRFSDTGLPDVGLTLMCQPEHRDVKERYFKAARTALSAFGKRYGPYPYPVLTLVDPPWGASGARGMEYPTLISCGAHFFHPAAIRDLESVTIHELGHQYFYGLLASNEFEEPWLDEGFTTYATSRVMAEAYGDSHPTISIFGYPFVFESVAIHPPLETQLRYFETADRDPLTAAWKFENRAGYGMVYTKTALTLATLERLIGPEKMDALMKTYSAEFRFRHPKTADFVSVVDRVAGGDWSTFFRRTFFSSGLVDYAVASARSERSEPPVGLLDRDGRTEEVPRRAAGRRKGYETEVIIERRGDVALPVEVLLKFEGRRLYRTVWDGEARWTRFRVENGPRLVEAWVDPDSKILLDANPNNNGLKVKSDAAAANLWTARAFFWAENLLDLFMELW
jgi:hypothetical protein